MSIPRPDRCIHRFLAADRPEDVENHADLAADLAAGRTIVAHWAVDVDSPRPKIVVVLGPVPASLVLRPLPDRSTGRSAAAITGAFVAVAVALAGIAGVIGLLAR